MFDIGLVLKSDPGLYVTTRYGAPMEFASIGPLYMNDKGLCSYATYKHLDVAWSLETLVLAFIPSGVVPPENKTITYVSCDDPQYEFFKFHNWLIENGYNTNINAKLVNGNWVPVLIGPGTSIHSTASVGVDGLRVIRKLNGETFRCLHSGYVKIGENCNIGSHSVIVRSVWKNTPTTIGDRVHIGNRVTVGHNVTIEDDVIIMPGAIICGRATVKKKATICAGAIVNNGVVIGERAVVSAGSLVTKGVGDGERVTGNFAVPHSRWIDFVKSVERPLWNTDYFMTGYSGIPDIELE